MTGRVLVHEPHRLILFRLPEGKTEIHLQVPDHVTVGDWVHVVDGKVERLAVKKGEESLVFKRLQDPSIMKGFQFRLNLEKRLRLWFDLKGATEVRTPLLVPCPGMETHIRPLGVRSWSDPSRHIGFLPTSPEFAMKQLIVAGFRSIYQLSAVFRDEPSSVYHREAFTMLEWYKVHQNLQELMCDAEEMILDLDEDHLLPKGPWPRVPIKSLFQRHVGESVDDDTPLPRLHALLKARGLKCEGLDFEASFHLLWLNAVEPYLDAPLFVTDYPPSQAALSQLRLDKHGKQVADRCELYLPHQGRPLEIMNAFQELTDADIQRTRFEKDMQTRQELYGPDLLTAPLDEDFLQALQFGFPPCSGSALGFDRLAMVLGNLERIDQTFLI